MQSKYAELVKPVIILFLICLVTTAALAGTHLLTADTIENRQSEALKASLSEVLEADRYNEKTIGEGDEAVFYYHAIDTNNVIKGYLFATTARGYGGEVTVLTAISPDGEIIRALAIDLSQETPGLGQNAANESFLAQFIGKLGAVGVVKNNPGSAEVQAVTGATITSKAVTAAINEALELWKKVK